MLCKLIEYIPAVVFVVLVIFFLFSTFTREREDSVSDVLLRAFVELLGLMTVLLVIFLLLVGSVKLSKDLGKMYNCQQIEETR